MTWLSPSLGCYTSGVPPGEGFRGVAPFVVTEIIILAILIAFPEISLFLPNLLG